METIALDGAQGEGGGQILRTALSLAAATGQGFRVDRIRAGRLRPGLRPQHLAAVRAMAMCCGAEVHGAFEGSPDLRFLPGPVSAGDYRFDIGTAGAATLVLQAVLPVLATATQGTEAPPALVKAIQSLNRQQPDVIIVARGGGSIEDLWAFNDERVVRAVAGSSIPVISGVGHETDFTLCDFAADLRAPTPTAAAELATQITLLDLRASVADLTSRLTSHTLDLVTEQKNIITSLTSQLRYLSPARRIQSERQRVDELARRACSSLLHRVQLQSAHVTGMRNRLEALSPLAVLARGYAVVTRKDDGSVISRVAQGNPGQQIQVRVSDGPFEAEIVNRKHL